MFRHLNLIISCKLPVFQVLPLSILIHHGSYVSQQERSSLEYARVVKQIKVTQAKPILSEAFISEPRELLQPFYLRCKFECGS